MPKIPEKYFKVDPWKVVEEGFDPSRARISESIFSLANEYMGVRGYFEEGYSAEKLLGSYFNCLYDYMDIIHDQKFKGFINEGSFMPNAVDWLYTRINIDGEHLDLARSKTTDFLRKLDLKTGSLIREFLWHTKSGRKLKLTFERFLSMVDRNLGCQRITLQPINFSGDIQLCSGLDFSILHEIAGGWDQTGGAPSPSGPRGKNFWTCLEKEKKDNIFAICAQTTRSKHQLFSSFRLQSEFPLTLSLVKEEKFIGADFTLSLKKGEVFSFEKMVVNYWEKTTHINKTWSTGIKLAEKLLSTSYGQALEKHKTFWDKTWKLLDIEIEGDPEIQQGIRYSLFQFYQTYRGDDETLNTPCKGLTAEVYYGWIFWDTETYCIPYYLFINPEAARKLLRFRYLLLHKALERAKQLGCEGARFPFTTIDGRESCGTWQHVDLEDHINTAIPYAIWLYVKYTDDKNFLYKEGIEMLLEICRYFASRGEVSPKNGEFGLYGVMGPDEFHTMVNNNCYTNVMVKKTFEYTLKVINKMKKEAPELFSQASGKLALKPEEPESWKQMAEKMRIPFDKETGIYEQHDGYFDLPCVDVKNISPSQIPIYANWPYIKIFRYDMIKQPDFLLLPFFYSQDYTLKSKGINYEYYESRCIHESSLSPSIHSILAAELGKLEEAYTFFLYTARLDLDNYNRNTEQGLHITAMSGTWLGMVNGFGGMRTDAQILIFNPTIPEKWKSYRFRIIYKKSVIEIRVDKEKAVFKTISGLDVKLKIYGKEYSIGTDGLSIQLKK